MLLMTSHNVLQEKAVMVFDFPCHLSSDEMPSLQGSRPSLLILLSVV